MSYVMPDVFCASLFALTTIVCCVHAPLLPFIVPLLLYSIETRFPIAPTFQFSVNHRGDQMLNEGLSGLWTVLRENCK